MMTVHEVSKLAGVSIRTLQYYDKIPAGGAGEHKKISLDWKDYNEEKWCV